MAGGVGTRFWPASKEAKPKQFLDVLGTGRNLLQMTFDRLLHVFPVDHIYVVTNMQYCRLVSDALPEIPLENILGEPTRNNTAPAVAYAAWKIGQKDPNAILYVSAADHLITKEVKFVEVLKRGLEFSSENNAILTLSIQPLRPDTGYGYIEMGDTLGGNIYKVLSFKEKPDLQTAEKYLHSGKYSWNSGNFFFPYETIRAEFKQYSNQIFEIMEMGKGLWNTDEEEAFLLQNYPLTEDVSIDYAILEKSEKVYTLPADIGWSDVGTWKSLFEIQSESGSNVINNKDSIKLEDSSGCLVFMDDELTLMGRGLKDLIIVKDGEVLMILPMDREQEVKQIRENYYKSKS